MNHEKKSQGGDPPVESPVSTRVEKKQVEERLAIGPHVVYETIRLEGEEELRRKPTALAFSALAAGLSMGFSFIVEGLLMSHLPDQPWRPLITKFGYSVGFLIVVLGRQQLFTENTVTVVLPVLLRKNMETFWRMLRLWAIVLVFNLVGTFVFALCFGKIMVFDARTQQCLSEIGKSHMASDGLVVLRAIFAGWLIALMVWLLPAAEAARVWTIIIITYVIGLGGFNHIIAGSTTMFFLVVTHAMSVSAYFTKFFLPTLAGNIIGGVSLVAALNHAQVVGGKEEP